MITVVGLVEPSVLLEDIGVTVPCHVAVNLNPGQMQSKSLAAALSNRKVLRLSGALPSGSVFRGLVANPPRSAVGSTAQPQPSAVSTANQELLDENERLRKEVQALKEQVLFLQKREAAIPAQLAEIQSLLKNAQFSGGSVQIQAPQQRASVDDDIPLFIPSTRRDDAVTKMSVSEHETSADLGASKQALKGLRKKQ